MKYIAYRLYVKAEDIEKVDDFIKEHGIKREYLGSNKDESLDLYQFLNLLKLSSYLDDNTNLIIYVEKEDYVPIIGSEKKMKVISKIPILCGRLGDLYEEQTLKEIYEGIHIEE